MPEEDPAGKSRIERHCSGREERGGAGGVRRAVGMGRGGGACLVGLAIYIYFVLPIGLIITLFWQPVMRAESERAKASRALLPRIGGTKYYLGTTKYLTRGYSCDGVRVLYHFGNDAPPVSLNIYLFSRTSQFLTYHVRLFFITSTSSLDQKKKDS